MMRKATTTLKVCDVLGREIAVLFRGEAVPRHHLQDRVSFGTLAKRSVLFCASIGRDEFGEENAVGKMMKEELNA